MELILEDNALVHVLAEGRTGDVAAEEARPVGSLVCPFVKEVS